MKRYFIFVHRGRAAGNSGRLASYSFKTSMSHISLLNLLNPARLLILTFIIICGVDSASSAPKPLAKEHIIVELTVKGTWDAEKVVVPVDRNQCVAGVSVGGGSDAADNRSASYSISISEVRKHKAVVNLHVVINSGEPIEIKFSVIKAEVRQYEFEQGIKVRAYYAGNATSSRLITHSTRAARACHSSSFIRCGLRGIAPPR